MLKLFDTTTRLQLLAAVLEAAIGVGLLIPRTRMSTWNLSALFAALLLGVSVLPVQWRASFDAGCGCLGRLEIGATGRRIAASFLLLVSIIGAGAHSKDPRTRVS